MVATCPFLTLHHGEPTLVSNLVHPIQRFVQLNDHLLIELMLEVSKYRHGSWCATIVANPVRVLVWSAQGSRWRARSRLNDIQAVPSLADLAYWERVHGKFKAASIKGTQCPFHENKFEVLAVAFHGDIIRLQCC
jgi:hypothetical protein